MMVSDDVIERPKGITVLAVLYFLGAVFILVSRTITLSRIPVSQDLPSDVAIAPGQLAFLVALALLAVCILGWLGLGLWRLRNWARHVTIVVQACALIASSIRVLGALVDGSVFEFFNSLLGCLIAVWIFWYLFQPGVKKAFVVQKDGQC